MFGYGWVMATKRVIYRAGESVARRARRGQDALPVERLQRPTSAGRIPRPYPVKPVRLPVLSEPRDGRS